MKRTHLFFLLMLFGTCFTTVAINEKTKMNGNIFPWGTKIRSHYDEAMTKAHPDGNWFLNLGPTGIRARLSKDGPKQFAVEFVFQDETSPAKGLVFPGDTIVGANGNLFMEPHQFGKIGRGWDGPLMELAGHLEKSQSTDGILSLIILRGEDIVKTTEVKLNLRKRAPFAKTFPYNCDRSDKMLEELCDFIIHDYKAGTWKQADTFHGKTHGKSQQLLALMASGLERCDPIVKAEMEKYREKTYSPLQQGYILWTWGYDSIIMGEYYALTKEKELIAPMESLAKAMPWGSFNANGIYTHRSHIVIRRDGKKPYASIGTLSGLNMLGMSLFKASGLYYDTDLYETIHKRFLQSAKPDSLSIAYFLPGKNTGSNGRDRRHAVIKLKDPSKGRSGKGVGYLCPTGMKGIGEYEIIWPTKADHRYKPTDWIADEADENAVEELNGDLRKVDRFLGSSELETEPTQPYATKDGSRFHAPVALGALSHLIGNNPISWKHLGHHGANSVALTPYKSFDGHAASSIHLFWSVLAGALGDQPKATISYLDYMKSFLILSECHDGGLYLQPWGRDPRNNDPSYGARTLATSAGIMLLALDKKRLFITGKGLPSPKF
jgi:hypothetical protein